MTREISATGVEVNTKGHPDKIKIIDEEGCPVSLDVITTYSEPIKHMDSNATLITLGHRYKVYLNLNNALVIGNLIHSIEEDSWTLKVSA